MKKTYWWRIVIIVIFFFSFGISYILRNQELFGICQDVYFTETYTGCFDAGAMSIGKPLGILSLSLILPILFLFFVNDRSFIRWGKFACLWFSLAFLLIVISPVQRGGWFSFGAEKSSVSFLMGILFVIISFVLLVVSEWREKIK